MSIHARKPHPWWPGGPTTPSPMQHRRLPFSRGQNRHSVSKVSVHARTAGIKHNRHHVQAQLQATLHASQTRCCCNPAGWRSCLVLAAATQASKNTMQNRQLLHTRAPTCPTCCCLTVGNTATICIPGGPGFTVRTVDARTPYRQVQNGIRPVTYGPLIREPGPMVGTPSGLCLLTVPEWLAHSRLLLAAVP